MNARHLDFTLPLLLLLGAATACEDSRLNQGKAEISVAPAEVFFKTLNVGEQDRQVVTVSNLGTASLQIDGITIDGDAVFSLDSWAGQPLQAGDFPLGLAPPGGLEPSSADLVLLFSAGQLGDYQGELVLECNDEDEGTVSVPLRASCAVPDIEVAPAMLDFGGVGLNSSSALTLTIGNSGQSDLLVGEEDLSLASGAADSPFLWIMTDMRVATGQSQAVQVIYAPDSVRLDPQTHQPLPDEDTLLIASNDPDENPVEVPLAGYVRDNLPPLVTLRLTETTKLDGTPLADPCDVATSDTARFEATVIDPEGDFIQPSNLTWTLEQSPVGSQRRPAPVPDQPAATFRPDMYGEYTLCVSAADPQGNRSSYDAAAACQCTEAAVQGDDDFSCPCIHVTAYPREDIRIELIWDNIGPDLDLHLLAPGGDYCLPTRECRFNPNQQDPDWDRFACVDSGSSSICRTPNCDPLLAGCQDGQECYDPDGAGPEPEGCYWRRCSSRDCYWDSRNPDWGVAGDESDDPLLAIDCTHSCRAENINLNRPEVGIYRVLVNTFEPAGDTRATVRIFFKGDLVPSHEWTNTMSGECDTWNVALIDWRDPEDHPVTYLDDSHSLLCCQ